MGKNKSIILLLFCLFLVPSKPLVATELHLVKEQWWIQSDYLLWRTKKAPLHVPLVTTASFSDALPGAIGQPGTRVLLGDKKINTHWQSGFKIAAGLWIDPLQQWGIEGSYFMLPKESWTQSVFSSGKPGSIDLAVPIYDVTGLWGLKGIPGETVFLLAGPIFGPGFQGHFQLKTSTQFQGSELNAFIRLVDNYTFLVDFIGGLRWLQLQESLSFRGQTAAVPNSMESGFYNFRDSFKTNNNFFGVQGGVKAAYSMGKLRLVGFTKIAVGSMIQKVSIRGVSQTSSGNLFYLTQNTAEEVLSAGILAEPTNKGSHHRNAFAAAVEAGIQMFYSFSECLEIGLGYNFLWTSPLFRPGDQIDHKINPTRSALAEASRSTVGIGPDIPIPFGVPQAAPLPRESKAPKFKHHTTDFWAQGLTIGVCLKF